MNAGNVTEEQARVAQKPLNRHNKLNSYRKVRTNHLNTVYRAPGCSIIISMNQTVLEPNILLCLQYEAIRQRTASTAILPPITALVYRLLTTG